MKDLETIAQQRISDYLKSDAAEALIVKGVEQVFADAISKVFATYGDLRKDLTSLMESKLRIDLTQLDLPSYNSIMLEVLKGQLNKFTDSQATVQFAELLKEVFGTPPEEVSIYTIVEKVIEDMRGEVDPCECHDGSDVQANLEFKVWEHGNDGYTLTISHPDKYSRDKINLFFLSGKLRISHRLDMNPTSLGSVQGWLFSLYAARTKITDLENFSIDECDLSLNPEQ